MVVILREVEAVCMGDHVVREGQQGRLLLIGPTPAARRLAIVLEPEAEPGVYFPITAHTASRQERRRYAEEKGAQAA